MSPLGAALDAMRAVDVRPDQPALPTPCAEFDVRGLLTHVVGWHHVFTACLTGPAHLGDPTHVLRDPAEDLRESSAALLGALEQAPDVASCPTVSAQPSRSW